MNLRACVFFSGALLGLLPAGCGKKTEAEPIWVGYLAPAIGADPAASEHAWRGVQLAVDEANGTEGQVAGRRIQVLHPDCPNDPEAVRAAAVRLVTINKAVALLGGTDPVQAEVLGLVAERAKVPLVAPGGMPNHGGEGFVFRTGVSPAYQGRMLARFVAGHWKGKTIAVLTNLQEGPGPANSALATGFAQEFRKAGGKTTGEWTYKTAAELNDVLGRLGPDKPDALLIAGAAEDLKDLGKGDLAKTLPIVLGTAEGAVAVLMAQPLANPVYLATAFVAEGEPATDFVRKYQDRFREPPDVHAALAYDSTRWLCDGLRRAENLEGDKIRKALADTKTFDSVTGTATLDKDHWSIRRLYVRRVEKGKAETVESLAPDVEGAKRD